MSEESNVIQVRLNRAEAMRAKHGFFRRFVPLEKIEKIDLPLFEQVCGIEFAKEFPEAAQAIRDGVEKETPVLIEGFALGYVPQLLMKEIILRFLRN